MSRPSTAASPPPPTPAACAPTPCGCEPATGVCAVMVTHHPGADLPLCVGSVAAQVDALVIVDNASSEADRIRLHALDHPVIELIFNTENAGVARALNQGIHRAMALGHRWALLLDQDSRAEAAMVATLLAIHGSFPEAGRLAAIGSGFADARAPPVRRGAEDGPWQEVESVITSGCLLPLAVYSKVGPFREELFIDHVDTDYCFRARAKGYRIIKTREALMAHAIGSPTQHRLLWMRKWTTNHAADRRYYSARNDTAMLRDYGHYPYRLWVLKGLMRSLRQCKRIALFERGKLDKMQAVMQGWWDGVRDNMGPRRGGRARQPSLLNDSHSLS